MRTELFSRNQPGGVFTITNLPDHPGELFFVDSNSATGADAVGYGKNPDMPFLTLDYAIGQCTADKGDVIYLMPGHAETKSASGSLFAADVAGIRIIGLGSGADRPTFTFSHTGAVVTISANGIEIENVLLVAGVDSVTAPMTISGADVALRKVEWRDTTDIEFVRCFITTAAADRLTVEECVHNGYTGGNASVNFCRLVGVNGAKFRNNRYLGNYSTAIIEFHTTACTDIDIVGDIFLETGTTDLSKNVVATVGGSTWFCSGFDLAAGCSFSGGSGAALAKDDVSAVAAAVADLQADLGNPSARTNLQTIVAMLGNPDVAAQSLWDALAGAGGLAAFPAAAAPANDVSLAEVLRDIWDALRNGTGGAEPGANKSVIDCLGTNGVAVTDSAVSVLGAVGADSADNAFASTNVVANADGSVLEREEFIQAAVADLQADLGNPSARTNLQTIVAMLGNPDVAAQSLWDALAGAGGLAAFPAAAAPANDVSLAEVLRDIWDALRNGTGGAEPGANKSVIDCLGTNGVAVTDSAVSVLGAVGADNADNAFASTNVVANADGSVLEREEFIQAAVADLQADLGNPSARTNLQTIVAMLGNPDVAAQSLWDALAGAGGLAAFPAAAAPANDVSLAEVLRDIWDALRNGTGGAEPATNRAMMDYLGASPAFFVPGLGYAVTKTEDIADNTTGDDLFTVTGKVLITLWTGEVLTDVIGADCIDYKLRVKTDNVDLCAASDIHGAAVTFIWQMNGDAGDTLINTASAKDTADSNGKGIANRVVGIAGGSLTLQSLHTDPNASTATMLHTLYYLPLEAGASVVAAA